MNKAIASGEGPFRPGGYLKHGRAATRAKVWLLVLAIHGLIIVLWPTRQYRRAAVQVVEVTLQPLPEKTLPPPPPAEEPAKPKPPDRPAHTTPPLEPRPDVPPPLKKPLAPSPIHRPDEQEWIAPASVDAGPVVRRASPEYAEQVKSRIISQVIYPANALYPAPPGFKGDPRLLIRECTVAYEVIVDRQGRIVSYELDPCQDDLLVPAAEAAILKAQPYPPPPDGAEQYRIYGSINFKKSMLNTPSQPAKQSR